MEYLKSLRASRTTGKLGQKSERQKAYVDFEAFWIERWQALKTSVMEKGYVIRKIGCIEGFLSIFQFIGTGGKRPAGRKQVKGKGEDHDETRAVPGRIEDSIENSIENSYLRIVLPFNSVI